MEAKEHVISLEAPGPVFGRTNEARPGDVPWNAASVLLALVVAVAGIVPLVLLVALTGAGSAETDEGATSSRAVSALVSTVAIDGWFVAVAWWHSLRRYALSAASWGFRRLERRSLLLVPVALVLVYVAGVVYTTLYTHFLGPMPQQNLLSNFPRSASGIALFAITAIVVAPLFEETFFRGFVFQGLTRSWGPAVGAAISAGFFALVHQQLSVFVPVFVLGLLLAWVFYRSRSLWTNITLHACFNLISVAVWAAFGVIPPFLLPPL